MSAHNEIPLSNVFPYPIIDIEASGLQSHSHPIEVAVVTADNRRYEALLRPLPEWTHWDEEAERLHGISRERLEKEGTDIRLVCAKLNDLCWRQTLYSDCWTYDSRWLHFLFAAAGMPMKFRCSALETVLTENEWLQWHERKRRCHEALRLPAHRAMNDAFAIAVTVDQMLSKRAIFRNDRNDRSAALRRAGAGL